MTRIALFEGQNGRVDLVDGPDLDLRSSNTSCVPDGRLQFRVTGPLRLRTLEFFGCLSHTGVADSSTIEAVHPNGDVEEALDVVVHPVANRPAVLQLTERSIALNAADSPVRYDMSYTHTIPKNMTAAEIIDLVKGDGTVRHLAISCHGQPVYDNASGANGVRLKLGEGFFYGPAIRATSNVDLFDQLYSTVVNVIWVGACLICGPSSGLEFCAEIARRSGCYVAAAGSSLHKVRTAKHQVELFNRSGPHYWDPDGTPLQLSEFLREAPTLGFKVLRVT